MDGTLTAYRFFFDKGKCFRTAYDGGYTVFGEYRRIIEGRVCRPVLLFPVRRPESRAWVFPGTLQVDQYPHKRVYRAGLHIGASGIGTRSFRLRKAWCLRRPSGRLDRDRQAALRPAYFECRLGPFLAPDRDEPACFRNADEHAALALARDCHERFRDRACRFRVRFAARIDHLVRDSDPYSAVHQ